MTVLMMWALSWDPSLFLATHVNMHTINLIETLREPLPHPCCYTCPLHTAICAFTCSRKLPNANSEILLKPMKGEMVLHGAPEVLLDLHTSHSLLTWCPTLGVQPTTIGLTQKKPQPQIPKRAPSIVTYGRTILTYGRHYRHSPCHTPFALPHAIHPATR